VASWNYSYDGAGRLTHISNSFGESVSWGYDGEGKLLWQSTSNGTNSNYLYNQLRGWPTGIGNSLGVNGLRTFDLQHDGGQNTIGHITRVVEENGTTSQYGFDALSRLTSEARSGQNGFLHNYGYDLAGNRTNVDGQIFTFDAGNKPFGMQHDLDGNVTRDFVG